jgi:hypothetical protein
MNIEEYTRDNVSTVEVTGESHMTVGPSVIKINKASFAEVLKNREICLAIEKRFKGKRTLYGDPGFSELVAWCLATDSYKVRQKNLERVSDTDVELAWEFIDTMSVSSTKACRESIEKLKGRRSALGFRGNYVKRLGGRRRHNLCSRNAVPSTLLPHTELDREGYKALEDVIAEDCMHWVLGSADPVASALGLRSGLLEGRQGGHDLGAHTGRVSSQHSISE